LNINEKIPPAPLIKGGSRRRGDQVFNLLDREIHGLLVDLRLEDPKTDEFIPPEDMVKRFMAAWGKAVDVIEKKVVKQIEAGKTEIKI
jgi:hypothetical protein